MKYFGASVALCFSLIIHLGCKPLERGASGPRQTLEAFQTSLIESNREAFLGCFTGDAEEIQMADAAFDFLEAAYFFQSKLTNRFGPKAIGVYESRGVSDPTRPSPPQITIRSFPRNPNWYKEVVLTTNTQSASFLNPQTGLTNLIVPTHNGWKLEARTLMPDGADPKAVANLTRRLAKVMIRAAREMDKREIDIPSLKVEMAKMFEEEIGH